MEEKAYLRDIQKLIGQTLPVVKDHPFPDDGTDKPTKRPPRPQKPKSQSRSANPSDGSKNKRQQSWSKKPSYGGRNNRAQERRSSNTRRQG